MDIKVYNAVKNGRMDSSIKFADFEKLIVDLGFVFKRQRGTSHGIYFHDGIKKTMNIQPFGNMAKD